MHLVGLTIEIENVYLDKSAKKGYEFEIIYDKNTERWHSAWDKHLQGPVKVILMNAVSPILIRPEVATHRILPFPVALLLLTLDFSI